MKREKLKVIVIMFAALTLILAPLVLAPSPSILLPMATSQAVKAKNTAVTGQGANTTATLIITGNITHPGQANTSYGLDVPCPQNWGILNTTLTLNNITAPNITIAQGNRTEGIGVFLVILTNAPAMAFPVSNTTTKLYNASFYIQAQSSGNLEVWVMNATQTGDYLAPHCNVSEPKIISIEKGKGWVNVTYEPPLELNASKTLNNTFFIALKSKGPWVSWFCVDDNATYDDGDAWGEGSISTTGQYTASTHEAVDFKMKVFLDPGPAYPSEIKLKITHESSGFEVEDIAGERGNGKCILAGRFFSPSGVIHFDADADCIGTVYFNVTLANSTLYRIVDARTNYSVTSGSNVSWTVIVDAKGEYGFPSVGAGMFINVSVPNDWCNTTSYAENETTGVQRVYISNITGLLFEATNGTWVARCKSPNVLSSLSVEAVYEGFEPVVVDGAVPGDSLVITGFFSAPLPPGTVNLMVFNDTTTVYAYEENFEAGGSAKANWSVGEEVSPGNYTLRLFVVSGLEVGLLEKEFTVSSQAPCRVNVEEYEGLSAHLTL
nr:hypothetical protein [Candidatus Freyrarchaeum guaymaensis]